MSDLNILPNDQNFYRAAGFESSTTPGELHAGQIITATGRIKVDASGGGTGTVTEVSVVTANGFAGTVADETTTPAITLSTTITGILKGNGTAISAITVGSGLSYDGTTLSATGVAGSIVVGTTTITSGTNTRVLYDNGGVLGEYVISGTGDVAMTNSPVFVDDITVGTPSAATGQVLLRGTTSGTVTLSVADAAGTWTMKLPTTDGDASQFLQTDGSGNTTWATPAGGGTIGGTIADTQVAYGSGADTIQGSANLTFDGTTLNIDADMRFANQELLLFRGATDVNPGILYVDGSNNFNINTESLTYPMYIDASVINIANNAGTGTVNIGQSGGRLTLTTTAAVFNENSGDIDFRVESNNNTNAIFVDAGNDRVGILNGSPTVALDVTGAALVSTSVTSATFRASSNDSGSLGASGTAFSDLFLASGAVIDFAAGNSVITHSSAVLTVSTGDLRVTTAGTNSASVVTNAGAQTITTKNFDYAVEPGADDTAYGNRITGILAGDTIAQWDLVYLDSTSGRWELADADALGTAGNVLIGLAIAAGTDGNALTVQAYGIVRNDGWTWATVGAPIFASTTPGGLSQTAPTGEDDVVRIIGYATSDDSMWLQPDNTWVIYDAA